MEVLKYQQLRQRSDEEKEAEVSQFEADQAKLQLESDILETKRSKASKAKELTEAKGAYPFDAQNIVNLQVELEALEDGLTRLEKLKTELF